MTETAPLESRLNEAEAKILELASGNEMLQENLNQAMLMLKREDVNWTKIGGGTFTDGFSLEDLKAWNIEIQNARVGNPHIKHGLMLRQSYILKDGAQYDLPKPAQGKPNIRAKIESVGNQRNVFGRSAYRKRETALFNCGLYLVIGNDKTHELEPVPLEEITDFATHPRRKTEIIAYRHSYDEFNPKTGQTEHVDEWIYVDHYPKAERAKTIKRGTGDAEKVKVGYTAFDLHANGVDDYTLGAPDALAALIWTRIVRDLTMNGVTMSNSLAMYAFKAAVTNKKAGDNASLALADATTPGSTAKVGGVNDLVPMSSAGKGYDFDSFRFVVATAAAALDVSVIALSSDPGTAGSSYGSAATLDLPTRLAMESRRDEHVEFDTRILRWMGAKNFRVYFKPYDDPTQVLRELQALLLKWSTGLYEAGEMKGKIESQPIETVKVPDGVMLPNNERYLGSTTADSDGVEPTQATPGQGQSSGVGKTGKSGDMRNDVIAQADFGRMADLIERLLEVHDAA